MKVEVKEVEARSILTAQKVGSLTGHYDYSLNPYAGCAFACSYCYVPKFPNARHDPKQWGSWVEVKINAPDLIRKDRLKVFGSRIFFSSATDPYQYLELEYRLSRRCLQELIRYQPAMVTMHTRSHLILQDIELLKAFGDKLQVGVSITTDDESIRERFEPSAPSIARRIDLIRQLSENGVRVYASISPLLPCDPKRLVEMLSPYVKRGWVDQMNWLEINNKPQLLKEYADFFAPANYDRVCEEVRQTFSSAWSRSSA
jgi:DNA repair photolyase